GVRAHVVAAEALEGADVVLSVVPCQQVRGVLRGLRPLLPREVVFVSASKGVETGSMRTIAEMVAEELDGLDPRYAVLSGPSFAAEVVRNLPTAVVLGCTDADLGARLREVFSTPGFRTYSSTDVRGVELGGAVKNVIAIAAGLSDGLGFGSNARAGLITRGLAEMSRLGEALGARASTFMGLSGLGDLVLTCTGDLSRNRQVGLRLAEGRALADIVVEMRMVAEGVKTTEAVHDLAAAMGVDMPITDAMYSVLHDGANPHDAVRELMTRELKEE
ncbi:NAD(P)H-dependent glycerol-3-phosphate dehydrogenase, partial [Nitratidesulfovibrio liaohensis]|uniref:NAD(P)H-dependent glycerol-3-phosphate dehydrogenase n=1 Tax=Nitratidesulfovibrio liaohensis TaxID=2604158 RepID=UPI0014248F03